MSSQGNVSDYVLYNNGRSPLHLFWIFSIELIYKRELCSIRGILNIW